jgi:predicted transposase YbfD/YdcC
MKKRRGRLNCEKGEICTKMTLENCTGFTHSLDETNQLGTSLPIKTEYDTRFVFSTLPPDPARLLQRVRAHWQIENAFHWVLDVAFREDECRIGWDHAPYHMATLRHIAISLPKQEQSVKVGIAT